VTEAIRIKNESKETAAEENAEKGTATPNGRRVVVKK